MSRSTRITTVLVGVTLVASLARAQSPGRGQHPRHGQTGDRPLAMMADELELSESQRGEIRQIVGNYRQSESGQDARSLRRELERLIHDPAADEQAVAEAARRVAEQQEQAAIRRHRMAVEIDALLTDEQRAKAEELREQRAEEGYRPRHRRHESFDPAG